MEDLTSQFQSLTLVPSPLSSAGRELDSLLDDSEKVKNSMKRSERERMDREDELGDRQESGFDLPLLGIGPGQIELRGTDRKRYIEYSRAYDEQVKGKFDAIGSIVDILRVQGEGNGSVYQTLVQEKIQVQEAIEESQEMLNAKREEKRIMSEQIKRIQMEKEAVEKELISVKRALEAKRNLGDSKAEFLMVMEQNQSLTQALESEIEERDACGNALKRVLNEKREISSQLDEMIFRNTLLKSHNDQIQLLLDSLSKEKDDLEQEANQSLAELERANSALQLEWKVKDEIAREYAETEAVLSELKMLVEKKTIQLEEASSQLKDRIHLQIKLEAEIVELRQHKTILEQSRLCAICYEPETIWYAFIPCGHTLCSVCIQKDLELCHICKSEIKSKLRIYID